NALPVPPTGTAPAMKWADNSWWKWGIVSDVTAGITAMGPCRRAAGLGDVIRRRRTLCRATGARKLSAGHLRAANSAMAQAHHHGRRPLAGTGPAAHPRRVAGPGHLLAPAGGTWRDAVP